MAIAHIPYGAYWSSPFARWQGAFAHLHSVQFAAHVTRAAMTDRGLAAEALDYVAYGYTVIQPNIFYGAPWFSALIGAEGLAGPTVNQACATGPRLIATAAGEMALGNAKVALVAAGDRLSNGAHVYYPAPGGPGGTGASENWVLDSFNHDPFAKNAMVDTAENVARREGIATEEQHELVIHRHAQYQDALAGDRAFQRRYMADLEVPDAGFRKSVGTVSGDQGIQPVDAEKMARLKPVREGGSVTFAGQTHPADGNAGMILCAEAGQAAELGTGPRVSILAVTQAREEKGFMPAAPIKATQRALDQLGLGIGGIDAIKSHNPFAVNDIAFARAFGIDWRGMNNYGSSLIWGHPQGPTGLRGVIELIEELEMRGGGTGLFQGCAAGDSAMAVVVRVG
ncbi:thiolase family protein [Pararhodobacter aggregans]|uniref:Acetyl-CoA acetyltransferase n=1 Tax=Pararhodobacter aggregans TaxID=404875 RepID=A0A2T7UT91_9RHOB|nr:thiolase family protein [Pararhodobacter aggregans]PTX02756.1 acetyl-CoA acetyltransferase [Pararhodobacter aggregans]PVE47985.1 acetyl-CoA acetyltransferase [Pararhodobacter aggregans]